MLLLDPNLNIKRSKMLKRMLSGWKKTQSKLHFKVKGVVLPMDFEVVKLVGLL